MGKRPLFDIGRYEETQYTERQVKTGSYEAMKCKSVRIGKQKTENGYDSDEAAELWQAAGDDPEIPRECEGPRKQRLRPPLNRHDYVDRSNVSGMAKALVLATKGKRIPTDDRVQELAARTHQSHAGFSANHFTIGGTSGLARSRHVTEGHTRSSMPTPEKKPQAGNAADGGAAAEGSARRAMP